MKAKKKLPPKSHFERYEEVRSEGRFNMYGSNARALTGLTKEEYEAVMDCYDELRKKYPDVRQT